MHISLSATHCGSHEIWQKTSFKFRPILFSFCWYRKFCHFIITLSKGYQIMLSLLNIKLFSLSRKKYKIFCYFLLQKHKYSTFFCPEIIFCQPKYLETAFYKLFQRWLFSKTQFKLPRKKLSQSTRYLLTFIFLLLFWIASLVIVHFNNQSYWTCLSWELLR